MSNVKDISNVVNTRTKSDSIGDGQNAKSIKVEPTPVDSTTPSPTGEINRTDPKVCHDTSLTVEKIVRLYSNQNKKQMEDNEISGNNLYDALLIDGIEYPLIAINNRNIENHDILNMEIMYKDFLPSIILTIHDEHENEQKIYTTQMSSIIRVCMVATVDNVYKKFLLNFRTYDVKINPSDPTYITYYGKMYIPGFRDINTRHIWMPQVCPCQPNCGQGGHINANTWEMLHRIAELSGLGFAATKKCKEIEDRVIRNIYSQRFDQYIEQQLLHCGTDEKNIFDAWVDLYGYIVMVNVPWVFNEEITPAELKLVACTGVHATSNNVTQQIPETVDRVLTNYNLLVKPSNMEIASYSMKVDNNSIKHGTLEQVYSVNFQTNITALDTSDVQSKQNSIDGQFLEDYNTGKNRPIPKFNFNDDAWTGLSGGYDLHKQKIIRNAYFRKLRQSVLNVEMKNLNLGLQRGILVDIEIFDNDHWNKAHEFDSIDNIGEASDEADLSPVSFPSNINREDIIMDSGAWIPNVKLSGLYYIDGMSFTYKREEGRIRQNLFLLKKGPTSGIENKHTNPRMDGGPNKSTIPQSDAYVTPNDLN